MQRSEGGGGGGGSDSNKPRRPLWNRQRSVSDGVTNTSSSSNSLAASSLGDRLPSVEEDSPTLAPPSPGTPPRKTWERQYRSFLSNRRAAAANLAQAPQLPFGPKKQSGGSSKDALKSHAAKSFKSRAQGDDVATTSSSSPSSEGSVRGGKLFANIFRGGSSSNNAGSSSSSSSRGVHHPNRRRVKSFSHGDELDGTMRRGTEKAYSPGNQRFRKSLNDALDHPKQQSHGDIDSTRRQRAAAATDSSYHSVDGAHRVASTATATSSLINGYNSTTSDMAAAGPATAALAAAARASLSSSSGPFFTSNEDRDVITPPLFIPPRNFYRSNNNNSQDELDGRMRRATLAPDLYAVHSNLMRSSSGAASMFASSPQLQYPPYAAAAAASPSSPSSLGPPTVSLQPLVASTPPRCSPRRLLQPEPHAQDLDSSSSAIKKKFTEFHNSSETGRDAVSAFLGDDPSHRGGASGSGSGGGSNGSVPAARRGDMSLAWTHQHRAVSSNLPVAISHEDLLRTAALAERSLQASATRSPGHSTFREAIDISKGMRILKPILGVDSWQQGKRYLIAPAALAACPLQVLGKVLGRQALIPAQEAAVSKRSCFDGILLGDCLLSYNTGGQTKQASTAQHWSSATLVLRQNYLLEYDQGGITAGTTLLSGSSPRGYAHLQLATCYVHPHFPDALELHFYGSPCAKSDKRTLMIRISKQQHSSAGEQERESWTTCLNRAAGLTLDDMYSYDTENRLGSGSYSSVYRGIRRQHDDEEPNGSEATDNVNGGSSSSSSGAETKSSNNSTVVVYNRALKIFEKAKFWRHVVNGRERADTIVRETSVQATLTARCAHQVHSFLQICGFFETSEHVVLELELLDGRDLFNFISSKSALPEGDAAHIIRDILESLDAMNRVGLSHRDIKPANVLMCSGGDCPSVKVGDFGMSTFVGVDGQVRGRCGTPGYVAPEIFSAGASGGYGNKVDIFSAGVTLYVMLCGYEPFYGETDEELKEANKAAHLEFPREDWSFISKSAVDLLQRMMHPDPSQRLGARQALDHPWVVDNVTERVSKRGSVMAPGDDSCVTS